MCGGASTWRGAHSGHHVTVLTKSVLGFVPSSPPFFGNGAPPSGLTWGSLMPPPTLTVCSLLEVGLWPVLGQQGLRPGEFPRATGRGTALRSLIMALLIRSATLHILGKRGTCTPLSAVVANKTLRTKWNQGFRQAGAWLQRLCSLTQ